MKRVILSILAIALIPATTFAATDLKKAVEKIQANFDNVKDFSANFKQVFHEKVLRKDTASEGKVKFKKPGFMRWDYAKPEKSFIVNGKELWIHQPNDKLAMVDRCFKQDTLTASLSFLWGSGDIEKQFTYTEFTPSFGEKTDLNIQLTPKVKSQFYKRLILVVDPSNNYQIKQSIVVDLAGNTNQFKFEDIQLKKEISQSDFAFTPPKGTAVSPVPGSDEKCKK